MAVLSLLGALVGLAFAGSPTKLAPGVRIAGVDVGGLSPRAARRLLDRRADALERVPVVFTSGSHRWRLRPRALAVKVDWAAAVGVARREGDGFGPLRGFRRLGVRVFGADVAPPTRAYDAALRYELGVFARAVERPHREAALVLHGLRPVVLPGQSGRKLDRAAAADVVVRALASLQRRQPVALPVQIVSPAVTAADLLPVAAQLRTALSKPVRLALGSTRWRLSRWRLAELLALPRDGTRSLRIGAPGADRYFGRLQHAVDRPPVDAQFVVGGDRIRIVPDRDGLTVDVPATARTLLAAMLSPTARTARLVVGRQPAKRTAAEARAMGITGLVGSYLTYYGGDPNRIHNVQLVSRLLDGYLISPGATFSFNHATGERTAARGFLEAPVIINGELETGLGGGVCQVSTTVFNAAYEAGLDITARTNHALYISHYPLGRDATVDYPDIDLRFVNDTGHWLLLRTFVGSSSLTVALYGTPTRRRVVSETAPLVDTAPPPVRKTTDRTLPAGETVIDDGGEPARRTSVRRRVYDASGKLLHDDTWYSSYQAEPQLVRVGSKPAPKPKPKPNKKSGTTTTETTPAATPPTRALTPQP